MDKRILFFSTFHFKSFKNPFNVNDKGVQAERRIIMMPLTGHGLVMDKSGHVYRYLSNQNKKDRQYFVDTCPLKEDEGFQAWYEWDIKMLNKCFECFMWNPNYFLQNSRQGSFAYIMKNLNEDSDADLAPLFKFYLVYWTATLN